MPNFFNGTANIADPDQIAPKEQSDLGLHYLLVDTYYSIEDQYDYGNIYYAQVWLSLSTSFQHELSLNIVINYSASN